ncbi:MAG: FAD-dependent oxidoreductase [Deltaproteobacteria bacterium]|nr:FAD-dependent oxidoreductase [Deltaproteobacteria bacterium]
MEAIVAKVGDLKDGEMKEVKVGETQALLTRIKGEYHAIGNVCTHYGGWLHEGCLSGTGVYCPWHQSRFNVITGDMEEPPALDAVPRFAVRVEGQDIIVTVPEGAGDRREPDMVKYNPEADPRTFVILGAGAAGNLAAQTLREEGFQGRVIMITYENSLPYDRPNLSKGYLYGDASLDSLPWRKEQFYQEYGIEIRLRHWVTAVDPVSRSITFSNGTRQGYDALLLASGGEVRPLEVPGADLQNVFTLRIIEDATHIIEAAKRGTQAVVAGAGFIGMEAAYSLSKRGLKVTVVAPGTVPFQKQLGPEIGRVIQQVFEKEGVTFRLGARVSRLEGDGKVRTAVLDSGEKLPADLVVAGLGVKPATGFLKGVSLNPDGSVTVDKYLRVADGLYAAGDIARFPDWRNHEPIRIEHWRLAQQHGRVAARNMLGKNEEFRRVPFFWSELFDVMPQYVGYAGKWDEVIIHGDLEGHNFVAFYAKGNQVLAAVGLGHDAQMAAIGELLRLEKLPSAEELRQDKSFDPLGRVKELQK